jgi:hypothetical protein
MKLIMPNDKVKFYKNSERNKPEVRKAYVPQYQVIGVEPEEFMSPSQKDSTPPKKAVSLHETRTHVKTVQPYAKMVPSPIGRGRGLVPNVGNNMEHTWSSVDGEIIDNISDDFTAIIDNDQQMIDNNEVVTPQALGVQDNLEQTMNDDSVQSSLPEEGYSLFVLGNFIAAGPLDLIQDQVRELVFGEHRSFLNKPVAIEDIVVFKIQRVKIKVGVFLE